MAIAEHHDVDSLRERCAELGAREASLQAQIAALLAECEQIHITRAEAKAELQRAAASEMALRPVGELRAKRARRVTREVSAETARQVMRRLDSFTAVSLAKMLS